MVPGAVRFRGSLVAEATSYSRYVAHAGDTMAARARVPSPNARVFSFARMVCGDLLRVTITNTPHTAIIEISQGDVMPLERMAVERAAWDDFVEARGGHILQTSRWGALKRDFGWQDEIIAIGDGGAIRAGALLLVRWLPLGVASVAYVPRGPVIDWADGEAVGALMGALDAAAKAHRAAFLKVEPDVPDGEAIRKQIAALGFHPSPQTVQPPRTIVVPLEGSEDDVLMRMSQSTRRKVRVAGRKGVEVRRGGADALESFNALTRATGSRNDFGVHSAAYYRRAYELFAPEHAALLMASYDGRDLAGLFAFSEGPHAWYFYGASSDEERNRMPTYLLQWEAMRWAREQGCTEYDLWGIPDEDEAVLEAQFQDRADGLWGVYGFKRGFGGEVVRSVGAWDRVYRPLMYRAYRVLMARRGQADG